ncbi:MULTISPECIES: ParB/RepB/Spo0J family partition protein [Lysobacter]|uniref:ParB/RepB/Spo0J family partition protein n=1 Tax=Lysobacter TaxID=68 RepID=UPI001F2B9CBA|nr:MULTISPECIES: ParB/RepB/Spo0J family partition protein [Lysobacter]UJB19253.1 ParB/RepB/Spo0J family partition protein [Lysobacter capsici]UJQ27022.1 ParB/RepB/Spo0J family partition protein [Lysobacter gummosus]
MSYDLHPLCQALPDMGKDQYQKLVADIRANGLLHPIILLGEQILDGRHRYRACIECGVEPAFVPFTGADPAAFVVSENLARRHLTESQRAMVGSKLAVLGEGRPPKNCRNSDSFPIGQTEAAKMLGVSRSSVADATRIQREGVPALVQKVEAGEITLHEASKIAKLGAPAQAKIVAIDDRRERKRAMVTAHNRSAGRTAAPRVEFIETVPGTAFVRDTLNRLEQITNQLIGADGTADTFVTRFLAEFDWDEPLLIRRLEHAQHGIEAITRLHQELERRSKVA